MAPLLSLAGLHWHEKDQRERRRATLTPVPTGAPVTTSPVAGS